jgi:hypothetical protein
VPARGVISGDEQAGFGIVESAQPLHNHAERLINPETRVRQPADVFQQRQAPLELYLGPSPVGDHIVGGFSRACINFPPQSTSPEHEPVYTTATPLCLEEVDKNSRINSLNAWIV